MLLTKKVTKEQFNDASKLRFICRLSLKVDWSITKKQLQFCSKSNCALKVLKFFLAISISSNFVNEKGTSSWTQLNSVRTLQTSSFFMDTFNLLPPVALQLIDALMIKKISIDFLLAFNQGQQSIHHVLTVTNEF